MSFHRKGSGSYNGYNGGNRKNPPFKTGNKSSFHGSSEAVDYGNRDFASATSSPPRQNKTPNKSGLTPVRPTKSPGTGMKNRSGLTPIRPGITPGSSNQYNKSPGSGLKFKSGLTPIRPGVSQGQSKSPFNQRPKLKCGLLPIKPNMHAQSAATELNCSSFAARRKSGLLPMKPSGAMFSSTTHSNRSDVSVLESKPFCFAAPKQEGVSISQPNGSRRKSGLLPLKKPAFEMGNGTTERQPQWKPSHQRLSMSNTNSNSGMRAFPKVNHPIEATPCLNAISEDGESPGNFRHNLSGLAPLDDTVDMSVVIRPRTGQGSARIPLPRSTLNAAHFSSSDVTQTRIPKRVLHFDEDYTVRSYANVLKDGSSKVNTMEDPSKTSRQPSESLPTVNDHKEASISKEEEALLQRKKEIENVIQKMTYELKDIEEQLQLLQVKKQSEAREAVNESENRTGYEDDAGDSPFAHVNSPLSTDPLELLTLDKSKRPENIYKMFRQSCSFLKTPQPSAFRKPDEARFQPQSASVEESPNISRRLQQQLNDLFDE